MTISNNDINNDLSMDITKRPTIVSLKPIDTIVFCQPQDLLDEELYKSLLCQSNEEQRAIFDDVMYYKNVHPNKPLHLFLTGGAGTGKIFCLKLLVQGLLRLYNKELNSNPQKLKALLMAFIGKATFNIDGTTIH